MWCDAENRKYQREKRRKQKVTWNSCAPPPYLNLGPIVSYLQHGLRSRHSGMNGQLPGQPQHGITAVASLIRHQQPDHSSSSHSNSRHSIQHEGHQRCLVFGKLPETHQQNNQPHHYCHHRQTSTHQQQHEQQQCVYYCCSSLETTGGNGGAIRWITARKNFNSVWLPLTTLSAPPSLEIYESRCRNYRRTNNDNGYNISNNFLADTKI